MVNKREAKGTFKRGARNLIEVYIDDEFQMDAIKRLLESRTFKSGSEFGRACFREYLENHRHIAVGENV